MPSTRTYSFCLTRPAWMAALWLLLAHPPLRASDVAPEASWADRRDPEDLVVMALLSVTLMVVVFLRRQLLRRNASLKAELQERAKLETQLTELVESASDVIFTLDEDGKILSFNKAGEQVTGYQRDQLIGDRFDVLYAPASPVADFGQLKLQPARFEMLVRIPCGSSHIWEVSSRPTIRPDNQLVIHCIARDVTDRKKADDELRRLYFLQSQQLENSPLAFIEWDEQFHVIRWSRTAETIFGWTAAEATGKTFHELELVYSDDTAEVDELSCALRDGTRRNSHSSNRNVTKDRRVIHVEWYNSTLLDDTGRLVSMMSLAQDVTARVAEETSRRLWEDQARQSQKMEAVGRLAGGVAHDFNNLLTVINGCSELLLREIRPDDSMHELAAEIRSAGEQAAGLTRQLLGFARREITNPTPLEVNAIVRDVEKMLRRLIGEHIDLVTDLDPDAGRIKADHGHMIQLLMNLAVNARDAMPLGGRLTVRTRNEGQFQLLEVEDTGVGMDAETKLRIFEPFFTTKPVGQATGIGLATVHSIVERAGGTIEADSVVGSGTTFRILLPTCADRSPAKPTGFSRRPDIRARETILLVEDEDMVRSLATRILEGKGYRVFAAPCPADAIDLHSRVPGQVDMLLSDVVMPGMGGRELADKLRDIQPDLRVLFMSGYTSDEVLRQGIREDMVHFVQKPFTPDGLLRKIRQVLTTPLGEPRLVCAE
ncbi:PAS domain-containing hybrid sensor histidine kinase/response regulator [Zavarzinella formosa]|uniref:PAS domain-containing hybrid sensor histidine kinase/response regulator n=1 Tax=Zavarzinella formosa TaxID=360055 RepID=UPI00031083BD|nr:PAS domain-containing sensor histidine kinase [Zavarzinella formosa]